MTAVLMVLMVGWRFLYFFLYLEMECERNEGGDWNENIKNTGI